MNPRNLEDLAILGSGSVFNRLEGMPSRLGRTSGPPTHTIIPRRPPSRLEIRGDQECRIPLPLSAILLKQTYLRVAKFCNRPDLALVLACKNAHTQYLVASNFLYLYSVPLHTVLNEPRYPDLVSDLWLAYSWYIQNLENTCFQEHALSAGCE